MATTIDVTCPSCGFKWSVDLAVLRTMRVIYKSADLPAGDNMLVEEYQVTCPNDQTRFIKRIGLPGRTP